MASVLFQDRSEALWLWRKVFAVERMADWKVASDVYDASPGPATDVDVDEADVVVAVDVWEGISAAMTVIEDAADEFLIVHVVVLPGTYEVTCTVTTVVLLYVTEGDGS